MLHNPHSHWLSAALFAFAFAAAAIAGEQEETAPEPDADPQRALFQAQLKLEEKLAASIADSADAARAFGQLLTVDERRRLQAGCSSLTRNPDNSRSRDLLRTFIERHPDQPPRVIARYCFDPGLHQLLQEVRATRRGLQQRSTSGGAGEFDFRLQRLERAAEEERRRYEAIRRIMLAGR